jgi:hypothetical protein
MPSTELATTEIIEINPPEPKVSQQPIQKQQKRFLCRHLFTDGRRCGSPALRGQNFCYYHAEHRVHITDAQRRRQRASGFDLTLLDTLDNPASIQISVAEVLRRLAGNSIDPKRASLILYGLQVAGQNLRRIHPEETARVPEDIVQDPVFGPLATLEPGRPDPRAHASPLIGTPYQTSDLLDT